MQEPFPVIGLIGARWRELGGGAGPFGNPLAAEEDVPGHRGRRQRFVRGEIALSVDSDLVTSVYRLRNEATFQWSLPRLEHDSFRFEISYNGATLGHSTVRLRSPDPRIDLKLQGFGEFEFVARSCDGDDMDDCTAWSIPVRLFMGHASEMPEPSGMPPVLGAIAERWHELGAWAGYLGKPTALEAASADGTRSQTFERGTISTAPAFPGMVIAAYQRGRRLEISWGGGDRAFNAFRVDVFHNGAKFLEALVANLPPAAPWARMDIAPGHYSFAPWKGDGDYSFAILPTLAGFLTRPSLPPNLDPNVTQDPPPQLAQLDFLTFPFGITPQVKVAFKRGAEDAEMKYPALGTSPAEAFASHVLRAQDIAKHHVHKERMFDWGTSPATEDNTLRLVAYLEASLDDAEFRPEGEVPCRLLAHALLRSLNIGHGSVGTSFDQGVLGSKLGDYDMAMKGLMVVANRYRHLLTSEQIDFIVDELMPPGTSGGPDPNDHAYPFLTETLPETENHLLMINSTRYLVNQIMFERTGNAFFNNHANGTITWLLKFLHNIARHDFLEFNSRPYQRLSIHALVNLHEFAKDPEVSTAAQIVLDYAFMKFAVSSCRSRRIAPFRRLHENMNRTCNNMNNLLHDIGNDQLIGFFLAYAGVSDRDGQPIIWFPDGWTQVALMVAPASYRPPPEAYQVAIHPSEAVQHRFFHGRRPRLVEAEEDADGGVEIYYKTPVFLLTAGGMFLNSGYGSDEFTGMDQVAYAQATTLLFNRSMDVAAHPELNLKFEDLIRFEQYPSIKEDDGCTFEEERHAVNTGVHEGFACGANLEIPARWLELTGTPATGMPGRQGWYLLDLNQALHDYGPLGVYVAAYRTPVRDTEELEDLFDVAPRNVGLLYVVDAASIGVPFTTFREQVLDRNSGLPATLAWDQPHAFIIPGQLARKFEFWLIRPDFSKYAPRVFAVDGEPVAPDGLGAIRLAEGPYLTAPGGHDGRIEIRSPRAPREPDAPLILDFTNVSNPMRLDNREARPGPWIERAQAIRALAGQLLGRSSQQTAEGKPGDAIISLRNAIRVLRTFDPPAAEQAAHLALFGLALHTLVLRLMEVGRLADAAAPADEAITVLRRAGSAAGANVTAIAGELVGFANQLAVPELRAQAIAAAQASADLLRPLDPSAAEQAAHLALFGLALHTLVLRLMEVGRLADAAAPADEAITVLRRAGSAAGANVTAIAGELVGFANQLAVPELRAQAIAAAQASADLLRPLDPSAAEQAAHLALFGLALHTLVLRLMEVGRLADAAAPADEAITVLRRAGSAAGANVTAIAGELVGFANQLAVPELRAQAIAAAQASADLLRPLDPSAAEQAAHLTLFGLALHTLVLRLMEVGRLADAAAPADEAITVLRRAGSAAGANVTAIAGELLGFANQLAVPELRAQAIAAAQASADLLRPLDPSAAEQAAHLALFGLALHTLVLRLMEVGRLADAAAPADEAITVLRRAGSAAGANVTAIAGELVGFANQLAVPELRAQAIAAAQASADLLRPLDPSAAEQAAHLTLFGLALHTLVLRLMEVGRLADAAAPADEAITVLRRAGSAAGANVTAIAGELLGFANQLAVPELRAQAIAAAQASADLLRPLDPSAAEQAAHLALFGLALHTLVLRLMEVGRLADAAAPADEAITVLRRAGSAAGANVTAIAGELVGFANQLAAMGLDAQSRAARHAANELSDGG